MRVNRKLLKRVLLLVFALLIIVPLLTILIRQQQKVSPSTTNVKASPTSPGVEATLPPVIGENASPPATGGKAFYVSPQGNDTNDGSQQHPFATIQKAARVVTPGTTVHVLPGTYTQPVKLTKDGKANARIVFLSETKWGAKIATQGSKDPWTTQADYIDIINFDVTATHSRDGIENQGSFIHTIGNHVHDIAGGCDSIGGSGIDDSNYSAHDDDIIGNVVDHIGSTYPKLCQYVHGIYHSTARGHIQNNIAYDNAGCGINLWHAATGTIVTNNLSFGNKEHGISLGTNTPNTDGVEGDHFLVANNISIDNALLGIRERKGVGSHNQYLNNIVYGNGDKPFGDEQYNWPSAAGSKDQGTITQDAQFVRFNDDGTGDYHLKKGSPAINAGIKLDAPSLDFDNNPRPQGTGIDIGPYGYNSN
jgi:hypothetical protein